MFKLIAIAVVAFIGAIIGFNGFEIVDTGHRGLRITYGEVENESLPEGLYFYNPLSSDIEEIDVRTQVWSSETASYTRDVQAASLDFTVQYNLSQDAAHIMYREVGVDWQNTLVPSIVLGSIKNAIGKWDAVDLIANRDKATMAIEESIKRALAEKHVIVSKFEITGIGYNKDFEQAVEDKVTAIQRAKEAENKTKQVEEEARQRIISAEAEAKSMEIRSQALSQNKGLVEYEAVQKWDGHLPTYMLGEGTMPFLNLGAK